MLEFQGQYATCKVMIDAIEPSALKQIYDFLNCPAFEGATIRIMPDVHAGAGAVIGFTSTLTDKVIPNVVGVDIGCGVASACIGPREGIGFADVDAFIREHIPSGFSVRQTMIRNIDNQLCRDVDDVCGSTGQDPERVLKSIGTLGGGNHFIEIGVDEDDRHWVTVHSGSRNFGLKIANHHQQKAIDRMGKRGGLEWLEGEDKDEYLRHMDVAQRLARANRAAMLDAICTFFFGCVPGRTVASVHNYIDIREGVVRKGAISAKVGERIIIPWNMRDGLVVGVGKGNDDWNNSAPHGAGRLMGRGQAKRTLKVEDFSASMTGVWSSCVNKDTIDESPMAYKPADEIRAAIGDTVEILHTVKPVYNFKAS